ncbi:MAG: cyclic nucleotide-binding domain-containing protein, partial [Pseudomonadales bacterium]|nr:cyclic nucleotide-binding domain-containing protein [Pseudomonadales bacterium]
MARLPVNAYMPHIELFLAQCHMRRYPARSSIIHAGEASDALYFIVSGSVSVVIEDQDGHDMIVAYLNAGDFFGEMGLFEEKPIRSAWIRAKTACDVAEISYSRFKELARQDAG